jgi:TolA-binding protein
MATIMVGLAAVGLGAWAFSLRSDVDDKDAQIAEQQRQIEEQQSSVAGRIQAAARRIADDTQQAMRALGTQIDEIQGAAEATQTQTQEAIDRAEDDLRTRSTPHRSRTGSRREGARSIRSPARAPTR